MRGFELQELAILYYALVRRVRYPHFRGFVESRQDAVFEYGPGPGMEPACRELVQCKKKEDPKSKNTLPAYHADERVPLGRFTQSHLKRWMSSPTGSGTVQEDLEADPNVVFTALIMGQANSTLHYFRPLYGKVQTEYLFSVDPVGFNNAFPCGFRHSRDPAARAKKTKMFGSIPVEVRQRVRVLEVPTWEVLRRQSLVALTQLLGVRPERAEDALKELRDGYHRRATAKLERNKLFTAEEFDGLLVPFKGDLGGWQRIDDWLEKENEAPADLNRGEQLRWANFERSRYVERGQFGAAVDALERSNLLVLHGYVGAGKSTLARFLAHRLLASRRASRGYVLRLSRKGVNHTTLEFLRGSLTEPWVFVIEDEHLGPNGVSSLVESFVDRQILGESAGWLIVTSIHTYSPKLLGRSDHPLNHGRSIEFRRLNTRELTALLDRLQTECDLRLPVPPGEVAAFARGNLGLAVLVSRCLQGLGDSAPSFRRLSGRSRLMELLRDWLLEKVGLPGDTVSFDERLVPTLIVRSFGLEPGESLVRGRDLLVKGGLIASHECEEDDPSLGALAYIVSQAHRRRIARIFVELLDAEPSLLPVICARLASERFGWPALRQFVKQRLAQIAQILTAREALMSLPEVVGVLASVFGVERRLARSLLRKVALPAGAPSDVMLHDLTSPARAPTPQAVALLFDQLSTMDRSAKAALARRGAIERRVVNSISSMILSVSCPIDSAARVARAVHRFHHSSGVELGARVLNDAGFVARLDRAAEEPEDLPAVERFCSTMFPVDRRRVADLVDRYFAEDRLVSLMTSRWTDDGALALLVRLHRLRPRLTLRVVDAAWEREAQSLIGNCNTLGSLEDYTSVVKLFHRLNRRVGHRLGSTTEAHASELVREENSYQTAFSALGVLQRVMDWRFANRLSQNLPKERIYERMSQETLRLNFVGRALAKLAALNAKLAWELASQLELGILASRITSNPLASLSELVHGFLAATRAQDLSERIEAFLHEGLPRGSGRSLHLQEEFSSAWRKEENLDQISLAISVLSDSPLKKRQVLELLGIPNEESFRQDVATRFGKERVVMRIAEGLFTLASFDEESARWVLADYSDRHAAELEERKRTSRSRRSGGRARRRRRKGWVPPDPVAFAALLRIASSLDPDRAFGLASSVDIERLAAEAVHDGNLGRTAVVLSGLHEASRCLARDFADRISSEAVLEQQIDQNERLANLIQFGVVLGRVSRQAGRIYVRTLFDHLVDEIEAYLEVEANLFEMARWFRVLKIAGRDFAKERSESLLPAIVDAREYDTSAWHRLEAAEAMHEVGRTQLAREFLDLALKEVAQLRSVHTLRELLVLMMKLRRLEEDLGRKGVVTAVASELGEWRIALLVAGERLGHEHPMIPAFGSMLFGGYAEVAEVQPWAATLRRAAREGLETEPRPLYRILTHILAGDPPEALDAQLVSESWWPWELGLAHVVYKAVYGLSESLFQSGMGVEDWARKPPRELGPHGSNLEFGLCMAVGSKELPPGMVGDLEADAKARAEDESRGPAFQLLQGEEDWLRSSRYGVWWLLRETILRPTYLPWQEQVRAATPGVKSSGPLLERLAV